MNASPPEPENAVPITSKDNEKLKTIRKLNARRRDREHLGLFVAEGEDLVRAADAAGWEPVDLLAASGTGLPGTEIDPALLASVTELSSGTRTLGVYKQRWAPAPAQGQLTVYLHGVGDPGNVGTVLRSAAAFSAATVVLGPGCADPFGPKAVRASMGAIFQVPVVRSAPTDAAAIITGLPGTTVALDARAERTLADVAGEIGDEQAVTLLVGAEREGLPDELCQLASAVARIPISTESLNAAVAAAVALYELTRRISSR